MQDPNTSIVYIPRLGEVHEPCMIEECMYMYVYTPEFYLTGPLPLCKLQGCNRPSYMDPEGKVHDFCGRVHARLYEQQNGY
jgi:hypothetical protein